MKKSNISLVFFIVFTAVALIITNNFIQSRFFSKVVSRFITKTKLANSNTVISFSKLKITTFPFNVYIKNPVVVKKQIKLKCLEGNINLKLNFQSFKLIVPNFSLQQCYLKISNNLSTKKMTKEIKSSSHKLKLEMSNSKISKILKTFQKDIPEIFTIKKLTLDINSTWMINVEQVRYKKGFSKFVQIRDARLVKSPNYSFVKYLPENISAKVSLISSLKRSIRSKPKQSQDLDTLLLSDITAYDGLSKQTGKVTFNFNSKHVVIKLKVDTTAFEIQNYFKKSIKKYLNELDGDLKGLLSIEFDFNQKLNKNFHLNINAMVRDFKYKKLFSKQASFNVEYVGSKLLLKKALLFQNDGVLSLEKPVDLLKTSDEVFLIDAKSYPLSYLMWNKNGKDLSVQALTTGKVQLSISHGDINLTNRGNIILKKFSYNLKEKIVGPLNLSTSNFNLKIKNDVLEINSDIVSKSGNKIRLEVFVANRKDWSLLLSSSEFNFADLRKIYNKPISGEGSFRLNATPIDFKIKYNAKEVSFLGLDINHLDGEILIKHNARKVEFLNQKIIQNNYSYSLDGFYDLLSKNIHINANAEKVVCQEALLLSIGNLSNTFKQYIRPMGVKCSFSLSANYNLQNKKKNYLIDLSVYPTKISIVKFKKVKAIVEANNDIVKLAKLDIIFNKKSSIISSGMYNLSTDDFWFKIKLLNIQMDDVFTTPLFNVKAPLFGRYKLSRTSNILSQAGEIKISPFKFRQYNYSKSILKFASDKKNILSIQGSLFRDDLIVFSQLDFGTKSRNKHTSFVRGVTNIDVNKFMNLIAFIPKHSLTDIKGFSKSRFDFKFNIDKKAKITGYFLANKLFLEIYKKRMEIVGENFFEVTDGVLNDNFSMNGELGKIDLKIKGDFNKQFSLYSDFNLDANILNVFDRVVHISTGKLFGHYERVANKKRKDEGYVSKGDLFIKKVKGNLIFNNQKFQVVSSAISLNDSKIIFNNFEVYLASGQFNLYGDIEFTLPFPKINLRSKIRDYTYYFTPKSHFTLNSNIKISGNVLPYMASGNIFITNGIIENSPSRIAEIFKSENQFADLLPQRNALSARLLKLKLSLLTNKLYMKNSLASLGFFINGEIDGYMSKLSPSLKIKIAAEESKIKFKVNSFDIQKGSFTIAPGEQYVDLMASLILKEYDIRLKVFGNIKNLNFELKSTPSLSQNDIFSLLTFGYTQSMSQDLTESDKNSIATLGVGSLLFEKLKLAKAVSSSLGIKFNLSSDIKKKVQTISSNVTNNSTKQISSSTKFEIRKSINNKTEMTFLNTIGNGADQLREMKINYDINKNLSFDGTYENISNSDNTDSVNKADSFGIDLNYKWSF